MAKNRINLRETLNRALLHPLGYELNQKNRFLGSNGIPLDMQDVDFIRLYRICSECSLCHVEAMYALYRAVEHVVRRDLPGDLVECGVYRGGSAMMMAMALLHFGCRRRRKIYLYDTYEGMSPPTEKDRNVLGGDAREMLGEGPRDTNPVWAYGALEDVRRNMGQTGYDPNLLVYVKGMVENTLPGTRPGSISLLRLDTDWYESTRHELIHLYPRLASGGILILDDYGHWQGARKAVDEYLGQIPAPILLHRTDLAVRVGVKA
jgi:O-methyltransferase